MRMRNKSCWAAGLAALMMLVCGGCGSAASPENAETPGGGTEPSATAVPEELDSTLEEVRTALQRQCEEGIIRCGYVVDTAEAFLETFELEQWEPARFTRFPSEAELSFTFSDSLSLLVSEEAGLAEVQLGEWEFEKEEKVYRLPEGTAAAMVRYAQEHHCLGREESLARCEAASEVSVADDQGRQGTVAVDEALGSLWTAAEWRKPLAPTDPTGRFVRLSPSESYTVTFWPDTGDVKISVGTSVVSGYQWPTNAAEALYAHVQEQLEG